MLRWVVSRDVSLYLIGDANIQTPLNKKASRRRLYHNDAGETNQKGDSLRVAKCSMCEAGAADWPVIHLLKVSAFAKMVFTS